MDITSNRELPQLSVCISGENVAVTVEQPCVYEIGFRPENFLYVFDWKTGFNKTVRQTNGKSLVLEIQPELSGVSSKRFLHESSFSAR